MCFGVFAINHFFLFKTSMDAVVVSIALLLRAWASHLTDYDGRLSRARVALRRNERG